MKILILGSDGYLGWPTTMHFANLGHEVFAVDNLSKRKIESEYGIEPINTVKFFQDRVKIWNKNQKNQINYLVTDLLNYKTLCEILSDFRPETIIHYAEQPSAPYSMANREKAVYTQYNNVIGNLNLLFAIKKYCPDSHLIKLGTMGEYGTPNIDIEEGWLKIKHNGREDRVLYPKKPGSFYHLSKVHDSANIEFACRIWGLKCTDLNQGFVYGITTKEIELDFENLSTSFHYDSIFGTIINRFITQMAIQKPMSVYGNGTQKRAFLDFSSLNEMANKIKNYGDQNNLKPEISHVANPRIEEEDHYYNPKNTSLISLGLKPIEFNENEIDKIFKVVQKNKDKINIETLDPENGIKWKLG